MKTSRSCSSKCEDHFLGLNISMPVDFRKTLDIKSVESCRPSSFGSNIGKKLSSDLSRRVKKEKSCSFVCLRSKTCLFLEILVAQLNILSYSYSNVLHYWTVTVNKYSFRASIYCAHAFLSDAPAIILTHSLIFVAELN